MVSRYGERIRAVPKGGDSRLPLGLLTVGLALLVGVGLFFLVRSWVVGPAATSASPKAALVRDAYDNRIDEELRDLGDQGS